MKRFIILILTTILLVSCVDLLQEPHSDLTPSTIVLTEATLDAMANGMYRSLWDGNYGFNTRIASLGLGADDMITGAVSKLRNTQDDQLRVPIDNADIQVLWKAFYKVIFDAN